MTMREKIARAICTAHYIHHDGAASPENVNREVSGKYRGYWFELADAALDALMEPTEGMIDAVKKGLGENAGTSVVHKPYSIEKRHDIVEVENLRVDGIVNVPQLIQVAMRAAKDEK